MKENVRKQGILLPVSSIPSAYGIGTFGRESYRFVDFLEKSGNRLWQILPLRCQDWKTNRKHLTLPECLYSYLHLRVKKNDWASVPVCNYTRVHFPYSQIRASRFSSCFAGHLLVIAAKTKCRLRRRLVFCSRIFYHKICCLSMGSCARID